jgi:hypothetical protein
MGYGLIANALAGGLAGGGAAAERAFSRLGETQARMDLEQVRGDIDRQRAEALARLQSELRRGDARYGADLQREIAERERGEVSGIIRSATTAAQDAGPVTPEMTRRNVRSELVASGRLREAAEYDKATEPPRITSTTTPYGSITTRTDEEGREVGRVDNASDIRAENERLRSERTAAGRAPKQLDQAALDRIHDQATKFADRLAAEMPHPMADPNDKNGSKDMALVGAARQFMGRALTTAAQSGLVVSPAAVEQAIREAAPVANERAMAVAEKEAAAYFDEKGRPRTGADESMKAWGLRGVADRDSFVRAIRDRRLPAELRAVFDERAAATKSRDSGDARAGAASRTEGGPARTVTDRQREDRGFQPAGLVNDAAEGEPEASPTVDAGEVTGPMTPWSEIERRVRAGDKKAVEYARKYFSSRLGGGSMPDSLRDLLKLNQAE